MRTLKYTKVISTIGPATAELDMMRALLQAGADCFRLNFSHGGPDTMPPFIERAREAARLEGVPLTLLADVQGPKIRIGHLPPEGVTLDNGQMFAICRDEVEGNSERVHSPYRYLIDDLEVGARVLFADGTIELRVERMDTDEVHCRVIAGGPLYSRKGLNLPGRRLSVATLTQKDEVDLAFIGKSDIDIVAISFVRSAQDLVRARELLGHPRMPVMAKLERPEALENLDEILTAADGVMVARGDLGVELPFEKVPVMQKQILSRAMQRGKWAVVATQMLGSMVSIRRPSRAEASDVVNAVLDGTDAVMLSEESAVGKHPLDAVRAMVALTQEGERFDSGDGHGDFEAENVSFAAGAAGAAVSAARRMGACAIVTLAGSGLTALLVSKWRPAVPIVALASAEHTLQRLNVLRGVHPVAVGDRTDLEDQLLAADRFLIEAGWAEPGQVVVMVAALPLGQGKETNTMRFHRVRRPE